MHIAQYTDTSFPIVDGVGRVVLAYARALQEKGESCFVVAPKPFDPKVGGEEEIQFIRYSGIPVGNLPYKFGIPLIDLDYQIEINRQKIDIVHAHSPFSAGFAGLSIAKWRGIPLVGSFHSKYYDDFYQATKMKGAAEIGVKMIVEFYKKCDEVWTVSHATAQTLHEYGYDGEIIVIENGSEHEVRNEEDIRAVEERFSLDSRPSILFVGQMNWKKNQLLILESAAELKRLGEDFQLVFVGQGPDEEDIARKAKELGLADNTVFTGHLTNAGQLEALYFRSDLFFFPSFYDTSGMVIREAAAADLPSLLARGSAASEVIVDGENGFLCGEDPVETGALLQRLLSDKQKLSEVGKRAKETIAVPWSEIIEKVLLRYRALIEKCAKKET